MALGQVRRVVTTHDASGKAIIQSDSVTPHRHAPPGGAPASQGMWINEKVPAAAIGVLDRFVGHVGIAPPKNGLAFTIVDFPPTPEPGPDADNMAMQRRLGPEHASPKAQPPRHPAMHRTRTVDYAIILSGEIDMMVDDNEIHLKAGDVIIQQATNHAWVNRTKEDCRIAFILIDAVEPLS
jgi:mannose-6-phosphate isomerase-like protein (cupin superfamily)